MIGEMPNMMRPQFSSSTFEPTLYEAVLLMDTINFRNDRVSKTTGTFPSLLTETVSEGPTDRGGMASHTRAAQAPTGYKKLRDYNGTLIDFSWRINDSDVRP
jgi:hypothetical protein